MLRCWFEVNIGAIFQEFNSGALVLEDGRNAVETCSQKTFKCISTYNCVFCYIIVVSDVEYTGCPRRNVKYFGRVFLILNNTDITQNTCIQSWTVTEIMAREKCGHLAFPRTVRLRLYRINLKSAMQPPLPVVIWLRAERTLASFTAHELRPTR